MWVAKFLFTPAGKAALALLVLLAWTTYQRQDAAQAERSRVTLAFERAKVVETERQKAVSRAAVAAAESRAVIAEAKIVDFKGLADALSKELNAAGKRCPLDDSVRKRLLAIQ